MCAVTSVYACEFEFEHLHICTYNVYIYECAFECVRAVVKVEFRCEKFHGNS